MYLLSDISGGWRYSYLGKNMIDFTCIKFSISTRQDYVNYVDLITKMPSIWQHC